MPLIGAKDVQEILEISESRAYLVIKELNGELQSQGYLTLRGRVEKNYLFERFGLNRQEEGGRADDLL